jgi:hypothetical protein
MKENKQKDVEEYYKDADTPKRHPTPKLSSSFMPICLDIHTALMSSSPRSSRRNALFIHLGRSR